MLLLYLGSQARKFRRIISTFVLCMLYVWDYDGHMEYYIILVKVITYYYLLNLLLIIQRYRQAILIRGIIRPLNILGRTYSRICLVLVSQRTYLVATHTLSKMQLPYVQLKVVLSCIFGNKLVLLVTSRGIFKLF
jgi:hypothetical protein